MEQKKSKLILWTEGVSGTGIRLKGNQGLVKVCVDSGEITFDAFDGLGTEYKRREETEIAIRSNGGQGDVIFKGTFAALEKRLNVRRKYGMTQKEIRDEIAEFTGDKKGEAMRKAKIFAANICISHVSDIQLNFGWRNFGDGKKKEDRNWLEFRWTDLEGDSDTFSIIE